MNQVVANLISNAADAVGHNGVITVRLVCKQRVDGPVVHLAVEDDGPGVTEENVQRIFEPFFTTKKDVGTGLGLWVVKEIVERHGGAIEVNSHDGNGSRGAIFTVQLPCNRETSAVGEEVASV
jgi:signal transduction histidine kinase